ncbi:MAG: nitrilase-related carbon-nitrogen hydrolase [Rhodospirillaceae bacterium]
MKSSSTISTRHISTRHIFKRSTLLGLTSALCAGVFSLSVCAQSTTPQLVRPDGSYPTVPLEKDTVVVKVVQNAPVNLQQAPTIAEGLATNVERMAYWINRACTEGNKPDFILFNEFPLTGYSSGSRDEKLKFTIQVPGPETKRIGELAKECDTYIIFGSYATDPDWPGHILSLNPVIGRDGEIKASYWKSRNVIRLGDDGEIPTTTVENVRDKFRAKYGIEEEFPVLKTEFGNIAVSTVQIDPFVFAAYAMRGVEIMMRTATLFSKVDVQAIAFYNNMYSAMSNITFPPESGVPAEFGGQSLIVGPDGKVLAEDPSNNEGFIEAEIPIAEFRKGRTIPRYPLEVVQPVFEQYQQEIPLNHLDLPRDQLPQSRDDMKNLLDGQSRWLNK